MPIINSQFAPYCLFENEELTILGIRFDTPYGSLGEDVRIIEKSLVLKLIETRIHGTFNVVYDAHGKPGIEPESAKLSISHTKGFVVIALSKSFNPGIDIEYKRPQLQKVAARVFHPAELQSIQNHSDKQHALQILWGAKEAMYKSYGGKELDFIKNIRIHPFEPTDENIVGTIVTKSFQAQFTLKIMHPLPDYFLVFVTNYEIIKSTGSFH